MGVTTVRVSDAGQVLLFLSKLLILDVIILAVEGMLKDESAVVFQEGGGLGAAWRRSRYGVFSGVDVQSRLLTTIQPRTCRSDLSIFETLQPRHVFDPKLTLMKLKLNPSI